MSEINTEIHTSVSEPEETTAPTDPATARLQQHLDVLYARIEADTDTLLQHIQDDLWNSFDATWQTALASHQEQVSFLFNPEAEYSFLGWEQVIQYRRDVHRHVFLKILSSLTPSLFSKIESLLQQYYNQLKSIESELPILIQVPENPDLFTPHPTDATGTRFRKWIRRRREGGRVLAYAFNNIVRRITFRKPVYLPQRTQNIPFKHLASYHLLVRIPEAIESIIQTFHNTLADQLAQMEHAQTTWLHALLEVEHKLHTAENATEPALLSLSDESTQQVGFLDESDTQLILAQTQQLDHALTFDSTYWDTFVELLKEAIQQAFDMLLYDTKRGGTILLSAVERQIPDTNPRSGLHEDWRLWHEEVFHRTELNNELLKFRDRLLSNNQSLVKDIHDIGLTPVVQSYSTLQNEISEAQTQAQAFCATAKSTGNLHALKKDLSNVRIGLMSHFKSILENVDVLVKTGKALEHTGKDGWQELNRYTENIPLHVSVHNPLPHLPPLKILQSGRYEILLGQLISSSVSEPRINRLANSSTALRKAIYKAWGDLQEVQHIVDFNLSAALSEISDRNPITDDEREDTDEEAQLSGDPISNAEKLTSEALTRSNESLIELLSELQAPWTAFVQECVKQTNRYWQTIHEDLRSQDQIHTWWENTLIYSSRTISNTVSSFENGAIYTWNRLGTAAEKVKNQFSKLIQKGQSAVGVVEQSEEEWLQTLNLVSNINSLHHSLPLIYQRLFSPNPLTEVDLIEGRKRDLDFIANHFNRWLKGQMGPLVLSMVEGSGRTSLMNVLEKSTFREARVQRIVLTKRVQDTTTWAEHIASAMDIAPAKSIEHLESQLIPRSRSKAPDVIIIDQFEHLLLCTPGGDNILERVLIFMSRTDHLIYWIVNINTHAWHYLENTIRPTFGFITAHKASKISRQTMEEIILKRHNRSGLTLRFEETIRSSTLRRLVRPRDEKSRQKDLRRSFFDRLYKLSGENIRLAILYWLQSVRYNQSEDTLTAQSIHPINFAFLDTLDQKRAFTLKTFMIHGTLTLKEHMRLFNMTQTESTFILESLLNLRIIEQTTGKKGEQNLQVHIQPDVSYRLHSLIRHPVSEYLSREHIIY